MSARSLLWPLACLPLAVTALPSGAAADAMPGIDRALAAPAPIVLKDGRIALMRLVAVPFARGAAEPALPVAAELAALAAGLADDCFLTAQVIGHAAPGPEAEGTALEAHRLARGRAGQVRRVLLAEGLPADAVSSAWDWQFTRREPAVTLWLVARPPGSGCSATPLAAAAPPPSGEAAARPGDPVVGPSPQAPPIPAVAGSDVAAGTGETRHEGSVALSLGDGSVAAHRPAPPAPPSGARPSGVDPAAVPPAATAAPTPVTAGSAPAPGQATGPAAALRPARPALPAAGGKEEGPVGAPPAALAPAGGQPVGAAVTAVVPAPVAQPAAARPGAPAGASDETLAPAPELLSAERGTASGGPHAESGLAGTGGAPAASAGASAKEVPAGRGGPEAAFTPEPGPGAAITFATNSSFFGSGARAALRRFLAALPAGADGTVRLVATVGPPDLPGVGAGKALAYNRWLAERRARRVAEWLQAHAPEGGLDIAVTYRENDPAREVEMVWRQAPSAELVDTAGIE